MSRHPDVFPDICTLYPLDGRPEVLPLVPKWSEAVLEVGCGRGGFGRSLRLGGLAGTIWAIEPEEAYRREAAPYYDTLVGGLFPDALADCPVRFDCIVFNDVLEHMADPWDALVQARRFLTPEGVVVASIPNVRNARTIFDLCVRGDWTYVDMGVLDRTHLRFFTRKSIQILFSQCGYEIESLRGINVLGRSRALIGSVLPKVAGDFAYTGFALRAAVVDR